MANTPTMNRTPGRTQDTPRHERIEYTGGTTTLGAGHAAHRHLSRSSKPGRTGVQTERVGRCAASMFLEEPAYCMKSLA